MNQNFVEQKDINHVIGGLNALYKHMIDTRSVDANQMKNFMERYFTEAGYRNVNEENSSVKNILIIHDSGVGDFILMSAVIREMRRIYPNAYISLLMPRASMSMAECCPYINKIVLCDGALVSYKDFFNVYMKIIDLARHLLRRRIDIAFNFGQYPSSQLLAYMSGAKEIIDHGWLGNFQEDFKAGMLPLDFFSAFSTFKVNGGMTGTHDNERYIIIQRQK